MSFQAQKKQPFRPTGDAQPVRSQHDVARTLAKRQQSVSTRTRDRNPDEEQDQDQPPGLLVGLQRLVPRRQDDAARERRTRNSRPGTSVAAERATPSNDEVPTWSGSRRFFFIEARMIARAAPPDSFVQNPRIGAGRAADCRRESSRATCPLASHERADPVALWWGQGRAGLDPASRRTGTRWPRTTSSGRSAESSHRRS